MPTQPSTRHLDEYSNQDFPHQQIVLIVNILPVMTLAVTVPTVNSQ